MVAALLVVIVLIMLGLFWPIVGAVFRLGSVLLPLAGFVLLCLTVLAMCSK